MADRGQIDIFSDGTVPAPMGELERKFLAFHRKNPDVYKVLRRLAKGMRERGYEKWSISNLVEVLRWERAMKTDDPSGEPYKLSNSYRAYYARYLMYYEDNLEFFFDVGRQTTKCSLDYTNHGKYNTFDDGTSDWG